MKKFILVLLASVLIAAAVLPFQGKVTPVQAQSNQIVLAVGGPIEITIFNTVTSYCGGEVGVDVYPPTGPSEHIVLYTEFLNRSNLPVTLNLQVPGTQLIFYLKPGRDDVCRKWIQDPNDTTTFDYIYYSNGDTNDPRKSQIVNGFAYQSHAHVSKLKAQDSWRIDFEDLPFWWPPDYDFNDLSLIIRRQGAHPDYRQNYPGWDSLSYDHTGGTIGSYGSALTAAANIANFMGAAEVDPVSLNSCLMNTDVAGYVRPSDDPSCPGGTCMAGSIRWTRLQQCTNPNVPAESPQFMEFVGKYTVGSMVLDPLTNQYVIADELLLKKIINDDLANNMPVILEIASPNNPQAVHYVIAEATQGNTYEILDPICQNFDVNGECTSSNTLLSDYGPTVTINSIVRYQSQPKSAAHWFLIVDAFAPLSDFYVVDPDGRRAGAVSLTRSPYNVIPNSGYYYQPPLGNKDTNQALGGGMNELYIIDPTPGIYYIVVKGNPSSSYNLTAQLEDTYLLNNLDNSPGTFTTLLNQTGDQLPWRRYRVVVDTGIRGKDGGPNIAPGTTPVISLMDFMQFFPQSLLFSKYTK